jgi:hypothetical protein
VRTAVAAGDLTPVEQLNLGLAAAALGDGATALRMETALLRSYGQRQGPWVRLAVGKTLDEGIHATSLLAMLAAEVGDPVADAADAHVSTHPTRESVTTLLQVGYVQAAIAHAPAAPARFAYTVDGVRREKDLAPGQAFRLVLAAGQAASLRLDPLSGSTGVASSWEAPAGLASTPVDPAVTITRTRSPSGDVPAARVVTVRLTLDFRGTLAQNECYEVTDLAPSGLVPVSRLEGWPQTDEEGNPATSDVLDPYAIEGQRVRFCAQPVVAGSHIVMLRYYARVVTVGTYVWEPAVAGSSLAPAGVARTKATTIVIR